MGLPLRAVDLRSSSLGSSSDRDYYATHVTFYCHRAFPPPPPTSTLKIRTCIYVLTGGFINGRAPGKLTSCKQDLAINLHSCFHLLFLLSFIRKTKKCLAEKPHWPPAQKLNETSVLTSKIQCWGLPHNGPYYTNLERSRNSQKYKPCKAKRAWGIWPKPVKLGCRIIKCCLAGQ